MGRRVSLSRVATIQAATPYIPVKPAEEIVARIVTGESTRCRRNWDIHHSA